MQVNLNSYTDLIMDCIFLCKAILNGSNEEKIKGIAKQRLSVLQITVDVNAKFASADEKKRWMELQNLLKGD